jgi:hypothetical protein
MNAVEPVLISAGGDPSGTAGDLPMPPTGHPLAPVPDALQASAGLRSLRGRLSPQEAAKYRACKENIAAGMDTFLLVGLSLLAIRSDRLYREDYDTYEEFCQAEYGWTARRARQLCDAVETVGNLKSGTSSSDFVMPAGETQVRPLAGLAPDDQRRLWSEAVESAPNRRPTERHVREVVQAWKVRTGLAAPEIANYQAPIAKPVVEAVQVRNREQSLLLAADGAIAELRTLLDLAGTADSQEGIGLHLALTQIQDFRDHQVKLGRMQEARPGAQKGKA